MSLWKTFKNYFQQEQESSPSQPLLHEIIERSEAEQAAFAKWKDTLVKKRFVDWLHQQYANYLLHQKDTDEAIDFLNTPSSKGFIIYLHDTGYTNQEAMFIMDWLREQVLTDNYRNYVSDSRTYTEGEVVENVQRHYLKPRIQFDGNRKFKQRFGNITIELVSRNEQAYRLRFRANSYQDRKFEDASGFEALMEMVVKPH